MSAIPGLPALDNTMGVILISVIVGGALWGITCMQTFEYLTGYHNDPSHVKAMVYALVLLDTIHQAFMSHTIYTYLVSQYANPLYLNTVVWSLAAQVLPATLVAFIVQSFFAWRVFILSSRNMIVFVVIFSLVLANFGLGLTYFVMGWSVLTYDKIDTLNWLSRSVNAVGAAGDIGIAVVLIFLLHRSKTGFSRSNAIVNQLILYSLNTGFITSLCAMGSLIAVSTAPKTTIFILFYTLLSRLYTNSLLATLNARTKLKQASKAASVTFEQSLAQRENIITRPRGNQTFSVQIDTETATKYDSDIAEAEHKAGGPRNGDDRFELSVFDGKR